MKKIISILIIVLSYNTIFAQVIKIKCISEKMIFRKTGEVLPILYKKEVLYIIDEERNIIKEITPVETSVYDIIQKQTQNEIKGYFYCDPVFKTNQTLVIFPNKIEDSNEVITVVYKIPHIKTKQRKYKIEKSKEEENHPVIYPGCRGDSIQ